MILNVNKRMIFKASVAYVVSEVIVNKIMLCKYVIKDVQYTLNSHGLRIQLRFSVRIVNAEV